MAKKRLEPYVCPDKPNYTPIVWGGKRLTDLVREFKKKEEFKGNEIAAIKHAREVAKSIPKNKWTPDIVLDPWLHYCTSELMCFRDARGYGPGWTNPYTLKEFLINWSERRLTLASLKSMYANQWLSHRQIQTFTEYLMASPPKVHSPLMHFAIKLLSGEEIIKPDIFIPNPFPPKTYGTLWENSYAFYKVPNFIGKDYGAYKDGNIYYCPQRMQELIVGDVLEKFVNDDLSEEYELFKQQPEQYDIARYKDVTNYAQFKFCNLLDLISKDITNSWANSHTGVPDSHPYSELIITKDPHLPGRTIFVNNSCVDLYNQVWTEELIKRTMWDRVTEHSLCMFNDAVHDGARQHINNYGHNEKGHHPNIYRRDYFTMPLKVRPFLHKIGVKPPGKSRGCTPEFHRYYPDGRPGDQLHPIFDYVLKYDKTKECIVPFLKEYSVYRKVYLMNNGSRKLYHQFEANGGKLRLTEDEWELLNIWAKKVQL